MNCPTYPACSRAPPAFATLQSSRSQNLLERHDGLTLVHGLRAVEHQHRIIGREHARWAERFDRFPAHAHNALKSGFEAIEAQLSLLTNSQLEC
jgi:hypothetical protein